MIKTKSEILLETFNRNELKSFNDYICFALKNKSTDVKNYWNLIYSPDTCTLDFSHKNSVSHKTLSDFNKHIEKYFILKNLEKDQLDSTIYLTRELRKRNIEKYFEQLITDLNDLRNLKLGKGFQNTLSMLKLNFEEYFLYNSRYDTVNLLRVSKDRIKLSEFIVIHSKLFEYINDFFFDDENGYTDSGLVNLKDVIKFVEKNKSYFIVSYPNVWTLYLIYIAINNPNNYQKIISALEYFVSNEKNFTEEFLQFGYDSILKLIFKEMNSGNSVAYDDFYKILLNMEDKGILNQMNNISPHIFAGFVIVSVSLNNLPLAEKMVTVYKNKIVTSMRSQVLNICSAMIEFAYANYDIVKKLLENEKPRNSRLYIFTKITLIKTYYENNELRKIYPVTDALKHVLKRRKDMSDISPSVNKFLNYTSKLAMAKKSKGKGLEYLKSEISKEKHFFQKRWVLAKMKQLSENT